MSKILDRASLAFLHLMQQNLRACHSFSEQRLLSTIREPHSVHLLVLSEIVIYAA